MASLPQSDMHSQAQDEVDLNLYDRLYASLRMLRSVLLKEAGEGVMAYHIFTNSTLEEICKRTPRTKEELLEINGIGKVKIDKYGDRLIDTIESAVRENQKADKTSSSCASENVDSMKRRRDLTDIGSDKNEKKRCGSEKESKHEVAQCGMVAEVQDKVDLNLYDKLYASLRMLRSVLLKEADKGVQAYHIFKNSVLEEISKKVPRTKEELLEINGIGKVKIEKYGDQLMDAIESTIKEYEKETTTGNSCGSENVESMKSRDSTNIDSVKNEKRFDSASVSEPEVTATKDLLLPDTSAIPENAQAQDEVDVNLYDKLYASLRMLRSVLLKEAGGGVQAYHIFTNSTLEQLSKRVPRTKDELLEINGIGKTKMDKYSDRLLDTIESTIKEYENANKTSSCSDNEKKTNATEKRKGSTDIDSNKNDDDTTEGTVQF